jgi:hypothetical protein
MKIIAHFSGGLELIFNKAKQIELTIDKTSITIKDLCLILKEKITEKTEFFLTKDDEVYSFYS